ncbi:MAG: potassium-transporting ATPase subunit KdpC [Parachlamydiaceae bacterium]
MNKIWKNMRMFLWLTLITGIVYPLVITGIAQLTMKKKADGDFLYYQEKIVGAVLIAQKFESDRYFWPRPSANDFNPLASGGSNLGPTSTALKQSVEKRQKNILRADPAAKSAIPVELLFASGSGLDPHISLSAAYFQVARVAKTRKINEKDIQDLVGRMAERRYWGVLGEPYVNVLLLNMALDNLSLTTKSAI